MKKIKHFILIFMCMSTIFCGINRIHAFGISSSSSVYVNSTMAVKIEAKGLTGRFDITSSNENILAGNTSKWIEDETITVYFTAKNTGTATITVSATNVSDNNYKQFSGSRSVTINVVKKKTPPSINVNPVYSKNNYLKSLGIEGYNLTPEFNKETLEYSATLEPGTEKINITAGLEDSKARIKGNGEVSVSEGINTLNVVVTAENGNERIYKITVSVDEKDPINIKLNDQNYTVVKKKEVLGTKEGYSETTVKINDFDIPALYNEVTKVTLIGLKDKEGKVKLFSYDSKIGEYADYKEFSFNLMNLYIHEDKNSKYKKINIKVNDEDVIGYELKNVADYYLLYATNTSTGNEGYYLYDKLENSVQRYNSDMLNSLTEEKDKYFSLVLVLSSVCFLTMLFLLIQVNRSNKSKNEA